MPIPIPIHREVEAILDDFCLNEVPEHARELIRYGYHIRRMRLTLYTERPYYADPSQWVRSDVAVFRYLQKTGLWTLYWPDRNMEWHRYDRIEPNADFSVLFEEVRRDPTGIFWS